MIHQCMRILKCNFYKEKKKKSRRFRGGFKSFEIIEIWIILKLLLLSISQMALFSLIKMPSDCFVYLFSSDKLISQNELKDTVLFFYYLSMTFCLLITPSLLHFSFFPLFSPSAGDVFGSAESDRVAWYFVFCVTFAVPLMSTTNHPKYVCPAAKQYVAFCSVKSMMYFTGCLWNVQTKILLHM